ncbi:hypothetical protein CQW23_31982 [Capsicum baccatum]|uniref:Uncharacterized protein n=1 Tax=Capsicum baccatum TaxID=33114 RepID=A0A2G2V628_CAPBA|nr:hypothetical protein CQW23_31982 [Capsicum baccatum]
MTCLRHCKAVVFRDDSDEARSGSCLLMNEVFSLIDEERMDERVFLKVQNSSKAQKQSPIISGEKKKSRSHMVIIGSTLAAFFGIIKISAESWGKEDFGALYEGTMTYLRFELATNRAKPLTVQYCLQYCIESNPPKFYYASSSPDSIHFSFDSQTLTAQQESPTSPAQFIKLQPDGHLRVYQWDEKVLRLEVISDLFLSYGGNCGYPTVCGRDGICTGDGRCSFPPEENFFMP